MRRTAGAAVVALFVLGVGSVSLRPPASPPADAEVPIGLAVAAGLAAHPMLGPPPATAAPVVPVDGPRPAPPPEPGEVAIVPPPPQFDEPPAPPVPPPPALRAPLAPGTPQSSGTWAVIIGINDYPGSRSDLRSAVNDANDMDLALSGLGVPADHRLVLRDGQATADSIRQSVDWLVSRAGPDAAAVFFYAGHVRKAGFTTETLVGADGDPITDRELGERLSHLNARRAWIAVAACYGGGFTEVLAPGRVLTGAAAADDLAYESSEFGRSYLVQYMVREAIIENRASTSVQAAFAYALTELTKDHPGRQPVQIDMGPGPLDLRPVVEAATSTPAPPALTAPPTPPTTVCRQLLLFACR